jgi:hypothetical protein
VQDGSEFDTWTSAVIIVGFAIPGFLFAILLIILFAGGSFLNIFPLRGLTSDGWAQFPWYWKIIDYFWHITLPLISMALGAFATMTLLTKNSFLDEIRKQYVMTARAKGCSERQVLYNHIFRNAMLIVIAGFPERVHSRLLLRLAVDRDHLLARRPRPARIREHPETRLPGRVRHTLFIFSLVGLVVNLISDLAYMWVDPRIDSRRVRSDDDHRTPAGRDHDAIAARRGGPITRHVRSSRRRSIGAAGRTSRPTEGAIGRSGSSSCFSRSRCLPISSPTTSRSSSNMTAVSIGRCFSAIPRPPFGGDFETAADYRDPYLQKQIAEKGGTIIWPPIRYSYDTHNLDLPTPAPSKPTWMLTEEQCKEVVQKKGSRAAATSNTTGSAPTTRAATWSRA